jgi:hypothetical protein
MRTGSSALGKGVAFEKIDLAAVRVAFGAVKTAAPDDLHARIGDTEETISDMEAE